MRHCQVFYVENSSHCCTIEFLGWTNDTGVYFYLLSRISRIAENRHPLTFSKLKLEGGGGCSADETSAQWRMQILGRHNRNKRVQRKRAVPIPGIQPTETSSKQILVSELDRLWVRWPLKHAGIYNAFGKDRKRAIRFGGIEWTYFRVICFQFEMMIRSNNWKEVGWKVD